MGMPKSGLPKADYRYTHQEYLDFERTAGERHEYLDGQIMAMAGEKLPHGHISVNLVISLGTQLKGKPCWVLTKDTKILSGPVLRSGKSRKGLYSYPDVVVVCGAAEYLDEQQEVILNPKVIIEVLSPSTEAFDRGEKCRRYQTWNNSLTDYIIVAQDKPEIEHFRRKKVDWAFKRFMGLDAVVTIGSIGCTLKLIEVYDRVSFKSD
jgi:Uma2 family endonuclease